MSKKITDKILLRDYALSYYFRYLPSLKRLTEKVKAKSETEELAREVLWEIAHFVKEEENIEVRIRYLIGRNKNARYIQTNLIQKGFSSQLVKSILYGKFIQEGKSLMSEEFLKRKILHYKEQGKSKNYIASKLIERQEDKELINRLLEEVFKKGEKENISFWVEKLSPKYEKKKILEKLLMKWFSYGEIKEFLEEGE